MAAWSTTESSLRDILMEDDHGQKQRKEEDSMNILSFESLGFM